MAESRRPRVSDLVQQLHGDHEVIHDDRLAWAQRQELTRTPPGVAHCVGQASDCARGIHRHESIGEQNNL